MYITTGRLITRPKFYPCVMTKLVINDVEKLSESQGFKTLYFLNCKKRVTIFPCDYLLAVVDWVHNDNETDDTEEDENKEYIDKNLIDIK